MRRKFLLVLLALFVGIAGISQKSNKAFVKKYNKKLTLANEYYKYDNFKKSIELYQELYKLNPNNFEVNFKLGVSIFQDSRDKTAAIKYFEKCKYIYIDAYYYLGILYQKDYKFFEAKTAFNYYKNNKTGAVHKVKSVDNFIKQIDVAIMLMNNSEKVVIKNLGSNINSEYPDYVPIISSDESVLMFTSRRPGGMGNYLDPNNEYYEDIYVCYRKDTSWSKPENLGKPVNTAFHDACVTMTPDGQQLYLFRTDKLLTGGDIYLSEKKLDKWLEPVKLQSDVNSKYGNDPSVTLSPDEQIMYFSSNREGGYGGKDIYKVVKLPNGEWSKAENLGPTINTAYDEDAPFMHPDGKTLYFSSKGHINMGGYDIFRSRLNHQGFWAIPQNMGYPINTIDDDIYFVVSANGRMGYYSSNREGGFGYSDIYSIEMPEAENEVVILKGKIINKLTSTPLQATITLIDKKTNQIKGIYRPHPKTGNYLMIVSPNKKYKMIVEADGFHNYIEEITIPYEVKDKLINKNIRLSINLLKTPKE